MDDEFEFLLELLYRACVDWLVDDREPELDTDRVSDRVGRRLAAMAEVLRDELARLGLSAAEVGESLGWSAGRAERVLAHPKELSTKEAGQLCRELGLTKERLFELTNARMREGGGDDRAGDDRDHRS